MITKKLIHLLSICTLVAFTSTANALLLLSGDGNITSDLSPRNYDNDVFFTNILQGGAAVTVHEGGIRSFTNNVNNFYNSLNGVSSSILTSGTTITSDLLAGTDLLFSILPADVYTDSEISTMSAFLHGGGSIFFIGEHQGFSSFNNRINTALADLGSSMAIIPNTIFDVGFHTATGSQIAGDPLNAGVSSFRYAGPSEVLVNGGSALFFGTRQQPFLSYEITAVPEPSMLALLSLGLVGFTFVRRNT